MRPLFSSLKKQTDEGRSEQMREDLRNIYFYLTLSGLQIRVPN